MTRQLDMKWVVAGIVASLVFGIAIGEALVTETVVQWDRGQVNCYFRYLSGGLTLPSYDWRILEYLDVTLENVASETTCHRGPFISVYLGDAGVRFDDITGTCPIGQGELSPRQQCTMHIRVRGSVTSGAIYALRLLEKSGVWFGMSVAAGSSG